MKAWETISHWAERQWSRAHSLSLYEQRTRPGATASMWIASGLEGAVKLFALDSDRPAAAAVNFAALSSEPVVGAPSSGYGYRRHPITKRRKFHKGVDFRAKRGTPVYAAGPGVVTVARRRGSYGNLIIISHGMGLQTRYAHLHRIAAEEGQFVPAGALIAQVGSTGRSTGPHLHFEVRQFDEPVDPHRALARADDTVATELAGLLGWLAPE